MYERHQGGGGGPPKRQGNAHQSRLPTQIHGINRRLQNISGTLNDFPPLPPRECSDFTGQYSVRQDRENLLNK